MRLGQEIEQVRVARGIPVFQMCNILDIATELEYHRVVCGHIQLDRYQKFMLIMCTKHAYDAMKFTD